MKTWVKRHRISGCAPNVMTWFLVDVIANVTGKINGPLIVVLHVSKNSPDCYLSVRWSPPRISPACVALPPRPRLLTLSENLLSLAWKEDSINVCHGGASRHKHNTLREKGGEASTQGRPRSLHPTVYFIFSTVWGYFFGIILSQVNYGTAWLQLWTSELLDDLKPAQTLKGQNEWL